MSSGPIWKSFLQNRMNYTKAMRAHTLVLISLIVCSTEKVCRAGADENSIIPADSKLELLHTRQVQLNSGLTEGPAVAPDGSIYFTDMPFGKDNGMILWFEPKTG